MIIYGPILNAYIIDCGRSLLYCIEIRDIERNKKYLISMKNEHQKYYNEFSLSKNDQSVRYKILCTKILIFENAEFIRII